MKAMVMTATGGPEVLQPAELPVPEIVDPHQIRVRLRAAGINPIDTKLRERGVFYPDALPAILGCDGAGEVEAVGDAVTRFRPGDRVWFCNGGLGGAPGNYAEYTVVDEHVARVMPQTLDYAEAAAGPLVLITAWEALVDRAGIEPGDRVLIHAGAGGVGHVAIQLARHFGARVATTVGSAEGAAIARELGAEYIINYHETDFVHAIDEWSAGDGAHIVLDTVGGETFGRSIEATAHYGDLVTLLDPGSGVDWREARNRNLRIGFELMLTPMLRDLHGRPCPSGRDPGPLCRAHRRGDIAPAGTGPLPARRGCRRPPAAGRGTHAGETGAAALRARATGVVPGRHPGVMCAPP